MRHYHDAISPSDLIDARDSDVEPPAAYTHYVALETVERSIFRGRIAPRLRAVCGEYIDTADSRLTATCPACRAWLDAEAEDEAETWAALGYEEIRPGVYAPKEGGR